jgi:hypothetical protein
MADFIMCKNNNCEFKEMCYRYRAIPIDSQKYTDYIYDRDSCLIPIKIRKVLSMEETEGERFEKQSRGKDIRDFKFRNIR